MRPRALVVSSVHPPDDPRIRVKLVETLKRRFDVTLAVRGPGPSDANGMAVHVLAGGRLRRLAAASGLLLRGGYDVASVHDPELFPAGIVASLIGHAVVFDVHENIPAQVRTKPWLPELLRAPLAWVMSGMLRLAERTGSVTLAEAGYGGLFSGAHPVFANYLAPDFPSLPGPVLGDGVVYVGDVTRHRGVPELVEAVGASANAQRRLVVVGRCDAELAAELSARALALDVELELTGYLPHNAAMRRAASCGVGAVPLLDLPNYRESMPTKLLEYLALGIPVVASDLPGTHRVAAGLDGVILVPPGDVQALARGLDTALQTSEPLQRQAVDIRTQYAWPGDAVEEFYLSLV